jgi:chromosome segregation ATPase
MTDTEKVRALKELIGEYWDIAWTEGREDRKHDTITGDGQRTWMAIEKQIDTLARQLAAANRQIAEGKAQWDRVAVSLGADKDCVDSVFAKAEQVSQRAEAAERRAAEVEQKAKRYDWLREPDNDGPSLVATYGLDDLDQAIDAAIAAGEKEGG